MIKINETIINPNYIVMIEPGIGPAYEGKYILQMFNTQKILTKEEYNILVDSLDKLLLKKEARAEMYDAEVSV